MISGPWDMQHSNGRRCVQTSRSMAGGGVAVVPACVRCVRGRCKPNQLTGCKVFSCVSSTSMPRYLTVAPNWTRTTWFADRPRVKNWVRSRTDPSPEGPYPAIQPQDKAEFLKRCPVRQPQRLPMIVSRVFTASLTALAIAGSAGLAFAQSNTSGSPASPAPAAANQVPPPVGTKPMETAPGSMAKPDRTPAPAAKGNNTSGSPASPAPAAANQAPPAVGTKPMETAPGGMAKPDRTPAPAAKGNNTSGSPASPAPAAANQAPPAVGTKPMETAPGGMAKPDRTPTPAAKGSNTSGSPSTPAPAAANQAPPPVGSTPPAK